MEEIINLLNNSNLKLVEKATGIPYDRMFKWKKGNSKPKKEDYDKLVDYFKNGNSSIESKNNGTLETPTSNKRKTDGLIPFYNADFIAGNAELYYADETIYPEYYMDVPEFSGSIAFRAYGDSMEPRIKSGNILFGVKRDNWDRYLEYGQIYGITCNDGSRYLKYIRKHHDKEFLLLKSENPNYDDMDMPKSEIKNIWLINGWIDKRT